MDRDHCAPRIYAKEQVPVGMIQDVVDLLLLISGPERVVQDSSQEHPPRHRPRGWRNPRDNVQSGHNMSEGRNQFVRIPLHAGPSLCGMIPEYGYR
jgi:hypothetical protein